jgi:hypothetical protein
MRRALLCAAVLALAAPAAAAGTLPRQGVLVPGRSLAGIRLGDRGAQVTAALGSFHGVCRGCARTTWYFTYRPFDKHGLGVEFSRGRVSALYTLSRPAGWHGPSGLRLGAVDAQVTEVVGPLVVADCSGYHALVADAASARTAYYIVNGRLWAFGLFRRGADPCR